MLKGLIKMKKKLQKPYLTYYDILIAQDLWQPHYQLIILLNDNLTERISKLSCKYERGNKKCKTCGIKYKVVSALLNIQTLKMI